MFLDVLECVETFFLRGGRSPLGRPKASGGRRPPQEQEARRASMFLYIYIYIYIGAGSTDGVTGVTGATGHTDHTDHR